MVLKIGVMQTYTHKIVCHPRQILNNVLAGILLGVMTLTNCISNAALIFSGDLAQFLPFGICIALMSGTLVTIIVAFGSTFPFALTSPDSNASALMAIMASQSHLKFIRLSPQAPVLMSVRNED